MLQIKSAAPYPYDLGLRDVTPVRQQRLDGGWSQDSVHHVQPSILGLHGCLQNGRSVDQNLTLNQPIGGALQIRLNASRNKKNS